MKTRERKKVSICPEKKMFIKGNSDKTEQTESKTDETRQKAEKQQLLVLTVSFIFIYSVKTNIVPFC
jgi:hypothetical protein